MTEWHRDGFVVTDDPGRVDLDVVHGYLANESYWALAPHARRHRGRQRRSWCFSLIDEATGAQVGFARLVTDRVTYGWLADVFVVPRRRARAWAPSSCGASPRPRRASTGCTSAPATPTASTPSSASRPSRIPTAPWNACSAPWHPTLALRTDRAR